MDIVSALLSMNSSPESQPLGAQPRVTLSSISPTPANHATTSNDDALTDAKVKRGPRGSYNCRVCGMTKMGHKCKGIRMVRSVGCQVSYKTEVAQWRAAQRILWPTSMSKSNKVLKRVEGIDDGLEDSSPPPSSPKLFRKESATGVADFPHAYQTLKVHTFSTDSKPKAETPSDKKALEAAQMMALMVRC